MEQLTFTLNNGRIVAAKMYRGEPYPITYANRTQAQKKQQELGELWEIHHPGRPFFIAKKEEN